MMETGFPRERIDGPFGGGLASLLAPWSWSQLQREVAEEASLRIGVAGAPGSGRRALLSTLRGWPASLAGVDAQRSEGAFALWDLGGADTEAALIEPLEQPHEAALVLLIADSDTVEADLARRHARLRALGRPLLVLVRAEGRSPVELEERATHLEAILASPVLRVDETDPADRLALVTRMVDACPEAAVAIGRELPCARALVAGRLVRRAAMISLLAGLEPVPLLDLPLHLATQMKLLARLEAAYGRAGATGELRALATSLGGALCLRLGAQQLVKLVPVGGWIVSGLLAAGTTLLVGKTAAASLAGRRLRQPVRWRVRRPRTRLRRWLEARRMRREVQM